MTEVRGQTVGNRAVRRTPRLAWETLVGVYGSEDVFRKRWESLKASEIDVEINSPPSLNAISPAGGPKDFAREGDDEDE